MKEFLLNLLNNLDKLAGLRQIENIYAAHSDANEARREINTLLDLLVNICNQFHYIPDQDKQNIIHHNVVTDQDFKSLNARIVYKWLNAQKDKYYKELAHIPTEPSAPPIPKDDPRYDDYCKQMLAALAPMEARINTTSAKREVLILGHERQGPTDYTPLSEDDVTRREKHLRYIKENFDAKTGKKLPDWMEEKDWNELND